MSATSGDFVIVPGGAGSVAALAALHGRCFPEEPWNEAAMGRLVAAPAAVVLLAQAGPGEPPVGFVLAFVAADEAEILALAVDPGHRRQGLARRLVEALIEHAADDGATRLLLEVAADNWPALGLYRKLGLVEVGRRKGYYARQGATPVDALQLARSIEARAGSA